MTKPKLPADHARHERWVPILLAFSLIWLGPTLACGSFAPRPTSTPSLSPTIAPLVDASNPETSGAAAAEDTAPGSTQPTPLPPPPADTPVPLPTPTFTATPPPGAALVIGRPARVTAPNGLNMRGQPQAGTQLIVQLGTNQRVEVVDGPRDSGGFTWWQVDDGQGNVGWVADGDSETEWLSPNVGAARQPVNRPPRVGDRVVVTIETQLTLRALPGTDAPLITRANLGTEFTVTAGPQAANGFSWFQIRNDAGTLDGWAADGDDTSRWLSPLE